jgi:alpha-aminoadipate carrier protein LysW
MSVDTQLICPNCHEDLDDTDLELFDVVECDNCAVELEVTDTDPIVLKALDEEEFDDTDKFDESSDFEEDEGL